MKENCTFLILICFVLFSLINGYHIQRSDNSDNLIEPHNDINDYHEDKFENQREDHIEDHVEETVENQREEPLEEATEELHIDYIEGTIENQREDPHGDLTEEQHIDHIEGLPEDLIEEPTEELHIDQIEGTIENQGEDSHGELTEEPHIDLPEDLIADLTEELNINHIEGLPENQIAYIEDLDIDHIDDLHLGNIEDIDVDHHIVNSEEDSIENPQKELAENLQEDFNEDQIDHIEDQIDHIEDQIDNIEDQTDQIEDQTDQIEDQTEHIDDLDLDHIVDLHEVHNEEVNEEYEIVVSVTEPVVEDVGVDGNLENNTHPADICDGSKSYLPNNNNCSLFYDCTNEKGSSCPSGMWFDPNYIGDTLCQYPEVICAADNNICDCAEKYPQPLPDPLTESSVTCLKDNRFHLIASQVSCGRYFICHNEMVHRMECRQGQHYNTKTEMCDYPEVVNCRIPDPDCPNEGIQFLPDSTRCEVFYFCVHGFKTRQVCPFYHIWDIQSNSCRRQDEVICHLEQ